MTSGAHPVSGLFANPPSSDGAASNRPQPPDTWGYVLFSYENYERVTGDQRFHARLEKPLRWLLDNRKRQGEIARTLWPRALSSDDWSDSYESMIVLWNRYPQVGDGFAWLDWATRQHIHRRNEHPEYGPFTGGHFDGSVGRTLCMHMMRCSQGMRAAPFGDGVGVGAVRAGDELRVSVRTKAAWTGRLQFDGPRTRYAAGTLDWARLNEMPQWFVAEPQRSYVIRIDDAEPRIVTGTELIGGLAVTAGSAGEIRVRITPR